MKVYDIELTWLYKGRYEKSSSHRESGSNLRAAVGKALAHKRDGFRETPGNVIRIKATVLMATRKGEE